MKIAGSMLSLLALVGCATPVASPTPMEGVKAAKAGYVVDYGDSPWEVKSKPPMPELSGDLAALQVKDAVTVEVVCDPTGKPTQAEGIRGPVALRRFASNHVLTWTFTPKVGPRGEFPWAKFKVVVEFTPAQAPR